jgi:hypothetical protein
MDKTPAQQLEGFLAKYDPRVRATAKAALTTLRRRLPGAAEFVYDKANALVIGIGPTERPSDAVFSIALYRQHVNLYFLSGAELTDAEHLLNGNGNRVRYVRLTDTSVLDSPGIRALMAQAIAASDASLNPRGRRRIIIRQFPAQKGRRLRRAYGSR